ncbi:hypothetical protein JYT44_00670 [Caldithrix abyssi]|nr:hypothetical protein [Caldithrix abyssi]
MFNKQFNKLKNSKKGQACYLIGDGNSIKWFDLKLFNNLECIPVSQIWYHNDVSILDIKYSTIIEPFCFYPICRYPSGFGKPILNNRQKEFKKIISKNSKISFLIHLSNFPSMLYFKNVQFIYRNIFSSFSNSHIFNQLNCFKGSFRFGISLAIYMGFDQIYLVGFDYTHKPSRVMHWYEKGQGIIDHHKDYEKKFIKIAKNYIDLTTITLEGESEHLNYIKYKDFKGTNPIYKENTDIVSEKYLKILSSWPGYSIY